MARTIIDVIQDNLDPATVSNVLFEMMLDWRGYTERMQEPDCRGRSKERIRDKRWVNERILARFLRVSTTEVRELLRQHYRMEGAK